MERIFHYTTLDNLELILSNATIRLSSLKQMDDITEGYTFDFGSLAKYFYVSSWSKESQENIPLWYMYTNKMRGIRIEADSDFLELKEDSQSGQILNITNKDLIAFRLTYDKEDSFLCDVKYTDYLNSCLYERRGYINKEIYNIGRIKPTAWRFQSEIRFRIYGISKRFIMPNGDFLNHKVWNSMFSNKENDVAFADIKFDINRFNNANFMLGPTSTKEDLLKLKNLVSKYIPGYKGQIQKSNLLIRFKEK
ncbi:hypothetical protein [Clostridium sp. ZBS4]|uniref:hypothetical protein n=1 Tax=Clostridium sp. ZBS4 TaxID=2949974 RepID=UPI00207AD6B5|nr:hypothetical protein [Clostridium sp. ZBS4]